MVRRGRWVLTGERKRARVEPRKSVLAGGLGAIEVAARLERVSFDDVVYPGGVVHGPRADDLIANREWVSTVGATWFLQPREGAGQPGLRIHGRSRRAARRPATTAGCTSGIVNLQFVL